MDVTTEEYEPLSKAKQLRFFLQSASQSLAARVLESLLEHRGDRFGDEGRAKALTRYRTLITRLRGHAEIIAVPALSSNEVIGQYVRDLEAKLLGRLKDGDLEGAITASRTLVEEVLGTIEEKLDGARVDYKGELPKQYKTVAKKLRLDDERTDLDEQFRKVVRGLVNVVDGLAPLSSGVGDRHPRKRAPALHHARVITNAARTVANFLLESYVYQVKRGLLTAAAKKP